MEEKRSENEQMETELEAKEKLFPLLFVKTFGEVQKLIYIMHPELYIFIALFGY